MGAQWAPTFLTCLVAAVGFAVSGHEQAAWFFGGIASVAFVMAVRREWGEHQLRKAEDAERAATAAAIEQALAHRERLSGLMGENFRAFYGNAARPEPNDADGQDDGLPPEGETDC